MNIIIDLELELIERLQLRAELRDQSLEAYIRAELESLVQQQGNEDAEEEAWGSPEWILYEAVREMKENRVENRELAVHAITQKNNLQAEVDREARIVSELERKAVSSEEQGNLSLAEKFRQEKPRHEETLASMRVNLIAATEAVEKIKEAIKREEERIRVRTAEAMAARTRIKQARIGGEITAAREQMSFSSSGAENPGAEWKDDFDAWMASLPPHIQEMLQQRLKTTWKTRMERLRRKVARGRRG
jgi:phage shock protein A